MRYFKYYEPDENDNDVQIIMSEDEIISSYYPFWKEQAIRKHGENIDLSFDRCLEEWICVHWAKEINRP